MGAFSQCFHNCGKLKLKEIEGKIYGDDFHEKAPKGILTTL
jgi:hypothetical protein